MDVLFEDHGGVAGVPEQGKVHALVMDAMGDDLSYYEEVNIRVVSESEGRALNLEFRQRDKATNVLSFPFDDPPGVESGILGDIAVCAQVVQQEARQQHKTFEDHFAHMVVHGILHLRGFDHTNDYEAEKMETLEIEVLEKHGIKNPYMGDAVNE